MAVINPTKMSEQYVGQKKLVVYKFGSLAVDTGYVKTGFKEVYVLGTSSSSNSTPCRVFVDTASDGVTREVGSLYLSAYGASEDTYVTILGA